MGRAPNRSGIYRLTTRVVKYLMLALFAFLLVCLTAPIFSDFQVIGTLVSTISPWFWRLAIVTICLMATSAVAEAL
ncbi:hypothetical protein XM38_027380 [Halomicronema hongdechloris C2206]|uniref:Uncharacterized protein n=2 Tax=Halomicronema hongdechloris TaxID=1209493 RepID=A0A1Z3HN88_9CYAN|nr:hypothetical protein XM38_027380 [Halomicronema hongdechloris C2206]